MPEKVEQKTAKTLSPKDLDTIAEYIRVEFARRKEKRKNREQHWDEIDRQVEMVPRKREVLTGEAKDWYPDTEMPMQANALEVIAADARRLKFPRGTEWYSTLAEISDEYTARWQKQRAGKPLISGAGFSLEPDSEFKQLAQQVDLDQETGNTISKAVMDHYHRMYDFRAMIDLFDIDQIKYGTAVARVRPVQMSKFTMDFRGNKADGLIGPAIIPCSIKSTYLDDTPHSVLHEGLSIAPLTLRRYMQRLDDLILTARPREDGKNRGWLPKEVNKLISKGENRHVEVVEGEGDFVIPKRGKGSIFLPNFLITIAIGQADVKVVRMRENPVPFRSYVVGHYMRDDPASPYGTSPLMKGRPIQEAATAVFNDLLAASRLSSLPMIAYDRHDQNLAAAGGVDVAPNGQIAMDSPNGVEVLKIGDVPGATTAYLALVKQYEDQTGVNDARRGAPVKSHTTTGGVELEASRGIARTDDFVTANEQGPLRTILYMEWEIIKSAMNKTQPVSVGAGGIEGWVNVSAKDLPENIVFNVHGSAGVLNERERATNFLSASQFVAGLLPLAQQSGQPFSINFEEIANEAYKLAGIQNAARFISSPAPDAGAPPGGPGVPGADPGAAEDILNSISPQPTAG